MFPLNFTIVGVVLQSSELAILTAQVPRAPPTSHCFSCSLPGVDEPAGDHRKCTRGGMNRGDLQVCDMYSNERDVTLHTVLALFFNLTIKINFAWNYSLYERK